MKMEQMECSEMSAYKIQTPGNYPEESKQHSENGESLKSRINYKPFCSYDHSVSCKNYLYDIRGFHSSECSFLGMFNRETVKSDY
jgi:hypothetical protein